jgi:hypothetical protein
MTTVSPGATRPTNAPVSRNANAPTSRYVQEQLLEVDVREQALDHEVGGDRRGDDHQQPEAVVAQRDPHR